MCRVDPWFPAGVALPLSDLARLPLDSAPTDVTLAATRAGLVATREARVAEPLMVAGTALPSQLVLFGNVGKTGIVGYRWLAGLSLTYDVTHGRARLAVGRPGDSTPEPGDEGMVNLR